MNAAKADRPSIQESDSGGDQPFKRLGQTPVYKSVNKIKTVMGVSLTHRCSGFAQIQFRPGGRENIVYSNAVSAGNDFIKEIKHAFDTLPGSNCCSFCSLVIRPDLL